MLHGGGVVQFRDGSEQADLLGLVAELDSPRTGWIRVGQRSRQRLQIELNSPR
jgi:hypothetical protein